MHVCIKDSLTCRSNLIEMIIMHQYCLITFNKMKKNSIHLQLNNFDYFMCVKSTNKTLQKVILCIQKNIDEIAKK